jgi:hypothetical protein
MPFPPINQPYNFTNPTPVFAPAVRDILSITNANPAIVTTTYDGVNPGNHGYLSGLIVRIDVPVNFGMQQLNQFQSTITVLSPSTFSIQADTTGMNPFVIPTYVPGFNGTPAQVVPIGEVAAQLNQSFINQLQR